MNVTKLETSGKYDPIEELCNAIIIQAAADYRLAARDGNKYRMKEIERFFLSKWFSTLSRLDGALLLKRIKEDTEVLKAHKQHYTKMKGNKE